MKRSSLSRRQHDQIIAELQRRHDAATASLKADVARLRAERDQFEKDRDTVAATARRDLAAADATISRLRADLVEASTGGDSIPALRRQLRTLQKQYDDAVGLKPRHIEDSSRWQPGYKTPEVA
jgi:chromosome segregation ATPase